MPHHLHHSREEIAKIEIGHTDSTRGVNWLLTAVFIAVIVAVPVFQTIRERGRVATAFTNPWPTGAAPKTPAQLFAVGKQVNNHLLRDIHTFETSLQDRDAMVQWLIPRMQTYVTGWLRGGNEDAYCGRDGWLFYRRDLDSLTGRGFLDPVVLKHRAATGSEIKTPPQPDPVKAIVAFRDQLAARGIALIVVPAPVKPTIHPERHTARYAGKTGPVQNPSFAAFQQQLAAAGVAVFDPTPHLLQAKTGAPLYLATDTHWTPPAMELIARELAAAARSVTALPSAAPNRYTTVEKTVKNLGDLALMLKLPADQPFFQTESVVTRQVLDANRYWRPDPQAEVLFLGDSFANIYSLAPMGWGEAAGFVEHLSLALGLPVDGICRNDAGAHATREMLAKELQRGHDRLAGKKLVIWEFAARELACGDWKLIPMTLGEQREAGFYVPAAGQTVTVRGVVRAAAPAPRPGSVPYKDHIVMVHLAELESSADPAMAGKEAVVFVWSMQNNKLTPAARYRPGDVVELRLRRWADVSAQYEAVNRNELDDQAFLFAEPNWGEWKP
jgi:alginate O-acetyltransferase complex protein AlgJ